MDRILAVLKAFVLWGLLAAAPARAASPLSIAVVNEHNYMTYQKLVRENGGDPLKINSFAMPHSSRVFVDMILIQQALDLGGCRTKIEFKGVPTPSRAILMVKSGQAVMIAHDLWAAEFDSSVFKSLAVFGPGDFKKIIYGRKDNERLMAAKTLEDLKPLCVVTGHDWSVDISTLEKMQISQIIKVADYDLQIEMVKAGRVDFGLLELPYLAWFEQKRDTALGIVSGIFVGLGETRHFMVSKVHPRGKQVYQCLEKGLQALKGQGRIKKAMAEAGVFTRQLEGWRMINP